MAISAQHAFDGVAHDANSPALQIASRQPGAHETYEKFLTLQSGPYLAHKEWLRDQPHQHSETVRFTLIASRAHGIVKKDVWLASLAETNQELRKPAS